MLMAFGRSCSDWYRSTRRHAAHTAMATRELRIAGRDDAAHVRTSVGVARSDARQRGMVILMPHLTGVMPNDDLYRAVGSDTKSGPAVVSGHGLDPRAAAEVTITPPGRGVGGRPDMAYYSFAKAIREGSPVTIFGDGEAIRDFTYIDDIVHGIQMVAERAPGGDTTWSTDEPRLASSPAPWKLYNIGHGEQVSVNRLIDLLEERLGISARRVHLDAVSGDVLLTHADTADLQRDFGFTPSMPLEDGLTEFARWLLDFESGTAS